MNPSPPISTVCAAQTTATEIILNHMNSNRQRLEIQTQRLVEIRDKLFGNNPPSPPKDGPVPVSSGFVSHFCEGQTALDKLLDLLTDTVTDLQAM